MTDPESLLTISAFAAASRLSPKALRLYDDLGLLPPARVDEGSGYRYYSARQLPTARLISLLRQLDLPLKHIQTVLNAPHSERPDLLRGYWAAIRAEQTRRELLARYVFHQLQGEIAMLDQFSVQTRHVPAQPVATLTYRVTSQDLPATIASAMRDLHHFLQGQEVQPDAAPFVIYHGEVNPDSDGPVEVCQPYGGTLLPGGKVVIREEAAHTEAFVVLSRKQFEFPGILSAYDAVAAYARQHGESGPLACREVYPYPFEQAAEDAPAGEVAWPYTPHGEQP